MTYFCLLNGLCYRAMVPTFQQHLPSRNLGLGLRSWLALGSLLGLGLGLGLVSWLFIIMILIAVKAQCPPFSLCTVQASSVNAHSQAVLTACKLMHNNKYDANYAPNMP